MVAEERPQEQVLFLEPVRATIRNGRGDELSERSIDVDVIAADTHVTTGVLVAGAIAFALFDAVFLVFLARHVGLARFVRLRRLLPVVTGLLWLGLWIWAVGFFWHSVYSYVFPAWARWLLPPGQAVLTGAIAVLAYRLAIRLPRHPVVGYCLLGGVWGLLSHILAIWRGILEKPPMFEGAHPVAAVVLAFFEFTLYFCIVVAVSALAVAVGERGGARRS
jgi:hypothetical protein